ncbi:hypothetical protein ABB02_01070 [Clostridiaceae bacterium JG1575]|nr:hypothetical protein ABB02_01070 [Clostridiaceae bacterium JG1575]
MSPMSEGTAHPIPLQHLPDYDLFLSQVTDLFQEWFPKEHLTSHVIQNYIRSEILTKPVRGRKRGYTRMHIIQLVLLCYMRPILTAEEIKAVFALAFNDINQQEDDIITWEEAYELFLKAYEAAKDSGGFEAQREDELIQDSLGVLKVRSADQTAIRQFIEVLILVTRASAQKARAQQILSRAPSGKASLLRP